MIDDNVKSKLKQGLTLLNILIASYLLYASAAEALLFLMGYLAQFILGVLPTPLEESIEDDFTFGFVLLMLLSVAGLYYCKQRFAGFSWRKVYGYGLCLYAAVFLLGVVSSLMVLYVDINFLAAMYDEDVNKAPINAMHAIPIGFLALAIIFAVVGFIVIGAWKSFAATLALMLVGAVSALSWANHNNISQQCFLAGQWEGSPTYNMQLGYLNNSEDEYEIQQSIYYVSQFYLAGDIPRGEVCYNLASPQRYALLKQAFFYYPEFEDFAREGEPGLLRSLVEYRAEQGDAPAMLLLAGLYVHTKGVEEDFDKAREWWDKAMSHADFAAQPDEWRAAEEQFIFGE